MTFAIAPVNGSLSHFKEMIEDPEWGAHFDSGTSELRTRLCPHQSAEECPVNSRKARANALWFLKPYIGGDAGDIVACPGQWFDSCEQARAPALLIPANADLRLTASAQRPFGQASLAHCFLHHGACPIAMHMGKRAGEGRGRRVSGA